MVSSEPTWHMSRVQKRVSKFVNFKVQKSPKTRTIRFDSQLGLLVCPLSFQKIYDTPMKEFFTLIEAMGEV